LDGISLKNKNQPSVPFFSQKPAASGSAFAAFLAAYRRQKLTPCASGVNFIFPQNFN